MRPWKNFRDSKGIDLPATVKARNQQRNWDTMNQIISLRCLPENITNPRRENNLWTFSFAVPSLSTIAQHDDDFFYLIYDANDVPMITGLDEINNLPPLLKTKGTDINCWFSLAK